MSGADGILCALGLVIATIMLLDGFTAVAKALHDVAAAIRERGKK